MAWEEAATTAIEVFGDPATVAAGFAPELAAVAVNVLPPTAAAVAGLAAVVADLTLLAMITGQVLTAPGSYAWAPVGLAAGASLTRAALAGRAARRCLAARAALA